MDPSCFYVCGLCEPQESEEAPGANGYRGHSPFVLDVDEEPEHLTLALEAVNCDDPRRAARGHVTLGNAMHTASMEHSLVERQCAAPRARNARARAARAARNAARSGMKLTRALSRRYREAIRLDASNGDAHTNLGLLLCDRKARERAQRALSKRARFLRFTL